MNQLYVSLIFIGIVLISISLVLIIMDKKKAFSFINNYEKKKQELVEIIYDAEQMIEELNKFSDYVVTQMDFKNEELSLNLKKANEEINALFRKQQNSIDTSDEIKTVNITDTNENLQYEKSISAKQEIAVNGIHYEPIGKTETLFNVNNEIETENLNLDKISFGENIGLKSFNIKTDKVIPINNKYNEVIRLYKSGVNEIDIARRLNMGKGEIQLILELNK